jgi:hypothetical protein
MIVLLTFPTLRDVFQGQNKRITYPEIVVPIKKSPQKRAFKTEFTIKIISAAALAAGFAAYCSYP